MRTTCAAKFCYRSVYDPPALRVDLDRSPEAIAKIKVEPASVLCHSQVDRKLFSIKECSRFEKLQRGAYCLTPGALAGIEIIGSEKKKSEVARANRMVLPVAANAD